MNAVLTARRAALVGLAVVGLVVTGCEPSILRQINPCGTIFTAQTTDEDGETTAGFCDPLGWDLLFLEIPDFSADPTCSIPGFCGDGFVPTDETADTGTANTGVGTTTGFGNTGFGNTGFGNTGGFGTTGGFGNTGGFGTTGGFGF